jgi:hypothetical protein
MPNDPGGYAAILYQRLHELDAQNFSWIAVEAPPPGDSAWDAIRDRLARASHRPSHC